METKSLPAIAPPLRVDGSGTIRVGKSRVTFELLIEEYSSGVRPEKLAEYYPSVSLAEVNAAIGCYLQNKPAFDSYMSACREESVRLERSGMASSQLDEVLLRLRTQWHEPVLATT